MKKRLIALILTMSVLIPLVFASGCYFDNDFYGTYHNQDSTVWLTLKENNFASIVIGDKVEEYYAEYLIFQNTINLRDKKDGNWGKVRRVIKINPDNIEQLTIVRSATKVDENGNDYIDYDGVEDIVLTLKEDIND
ncbi:MAG: hypothetical protein J6X29_02585 [Clostridia bacterium]|nr:hypothetical protein [Clostridia bacterium]MBP5648871.1 hypothetical protein [Clostridia bacterium]